MEKKEGFRRTNYEMVSARGVDALGGQPFFRLAPAFANSPPFSSGVTSEG